MTPDLPAGVDDNLYEDPAVSNRLSARRADQPVYRGVGQFEDILFRYL